MASDPLRMHSNEVIRSTGVFLEPYIFTEMWNAVGMELNFVCSETSPTPIG